MLPAPRVVPHCIAFRRFAARAAAAADNAAPKADALVKELEPTLGLLGRQLRLGQQLVGQIYEPVPPTVQKVGPGEMPPSADDEKGETTEGAFLVGNAAVKAALASPDEWDLIHPLKWCGLNTYEPYDKQGGEAPRSATAMLSAIAQIWKCAICGGGGEPASASLRPPLSTACVVLAMPDLFDRRLGSQLLSILLEPSGLHFKAAILHEEAACAAFGAGGNAACVVDIGHERTSVCCVDEGMRCQDAVRSSPTRASTWTCSLTPYLHRQKLLKPVTNELPMLTTTAPSYEPTLQTSTALRTIRHDACSLLLNDHPSMIPYATLTAANAPRTACASTSARSPLCPASFYSRRPLPQAFRKALGFTGPPNPPTAGAQVRSFRFVGRRLYQRHGIGPCVASRGDSAGPRELYIGSACFAPALTEIGQLHTSGFTPDSSLGFTPLDEAIVRAVERGKSTEVKRRLYGTILLLGGGARTPGLSEYLEWRISSLWAIAADAVEGIERVEVKRLPEGTDPESVSWRGAATLPVLESGRGLWIWREDWDKKGVLACREVCGFTW